MASLDKVRDLQQEFQAKKSVKQYLALSLFE
jgi:hypothetical protein